METKIYTTEEIKSLITQTVINKSDGKVSKVSNNSVLNGLSYGLAKVCQKTLKEIALIESQIFPDYAYGSYLDKVAERNGISSRLPSTGSSVYVRLVAEPNTLYQAASCVFTSTSGINFVLSEDFLISSHGFGYAILRSTDTGSNTNVPANSINNIINKPSGHIYVTNEMDAWGGSDIESDDFYRNRILQNFNNFAFDTLSKIKSVFSKLNPLILDVKKVGIDFQGKTILGIVTINGVELSLAELQDLLSNSKYYLSLEEQSFTGDLGFEPRLKIINLPFTYIDIDFRVDLESNYDPEQIKRDIQIAVSKYFDFRYWSNKNVEWEEVYYTIRGVNGIKIIPEQFFNPSSDITIPKSSLPRLRGFIMRNMGGVVISENNNVVPVYYSDQYNVNLLNQINVNYE